MSGSTRSLGVHIYDTVPDQCSREIIQNTRAPGQADLMSPSLVSDMDPETLGVYIASTVQGTRYTIKHWQLYTNCTKGVLCSAAGVYAAGRRWTRERGRQLEDPGGDHPGYEAF